MPLMGDSEPDGLVVGFVLPEFLFVVEPLRLLVFVDNFLLKTGIIFHRFPPEI